MSFIRRWFGSNEKGNGENISKKSDMSEESEEEIAMRNIKAGIKRAQENNEFLDRVKKDDHYIQQVTELGWTLTDIKGIGQVTAEKLANAGIHNPVQLLFAEDMEDDFPDVANYISRFVEQLKKQLDNEGGDN